MLELEYKENPEHGLRMILTFETQTSFLVPLDRCIHLARTAVQNPPPGSILVPPPRLTSPNFTLFRLWLPLLTSPLRTSP